jgi:uncharacterized protein
MNVGEFLLALLRTRVFWVLAVTYLVVHLTKFFVHHYRFREWSINPFFDTGGMPSGHTAVTVALTICIAFETGPSLLFITSFIFTMIIIRDSYGVRKSVSDQANIINALLSEMKIHKKVKIVLGHTPLQVAAGFVVGIIVPTVIYLLF